MKKKRFGWGIVFYAAITLTLLSGIFFSIWVNRWFSFGRNALSDLGNPRRTPYYEVFNYTLIICGLLYAGYMAVSFRSYRPKTAFLLFLASILLALVGVFHEGFRNLHFLVSILFFVTGITSLAVYWAERNSLYGIAGYFSSLAMFIVQEAYGEHVGIAVPELVSGLLFYAIPLVEYVHRRSRSRG